MADGSELSSSLRRGTLEFCVLAIVETQDRYSTEIVRSIGMEKQLTTSEGTIYPMLSRLRRSGLLGGEWVESANGPPRRYYHLTDAGKLALENFRREWVQFSRAVDRIVRTEDNDGTD